MYSDALQTMAATGTPPRAPPRAPPRVPVSEALYDEYVKKPCARMALHVALFSGALLAFVLLRDACSYCLLLVIPVCCVVGYCSPWVHVFSAASVVVLLWRGAVMPFGMYTLTIDPAHKFIT